MSRELFEKFNEKTIPKINIVNWWPHVELFAQITRNGNLYLYGYDIPAMPTFNEIFNAEIFDELTFHVDGAKNDIGRNNFIPPNNE
jgi:hypothetical protein